MTGMNVTGAHAQAAKMAATIPRLAASEGSGERPPTLPAAALSTVTTAAIPITIHAGVGSGRPSTSSSNMPKKAVSTTRPPRNPSGATAIAAASER
ncbi:MAG: hypothetical protein M5U28_55330 [Sandaracinaceae bacterium]|nr:hypothetical protein [Sandaracinaceae bacterium]